MDPMHSAAPEPSIPLNEGYAREDSYAAIARQAIECEIADCHQGLATQHSHIKFYIGTYLLVLMGLFSYCGYLGNQPPSVTLSVLGGVAGLLQFGLGWLLLAVLSHKMSMIIMLYKHLSGMRAHRTESLPPGTPYMWPTNPNYVRPPQLTYVTPYIFFALNFLVLLGPIIFFAIRHLDMYQSVSLAVVVGSIVGSFYPRVCVTFNKHLRASLDAVDLEDKWQRERRWEDQRQKVATRSRLKYLIFALLVAWSVFLFLDSLRAPDSWLSPPMGPCLLVIFVVFFALTRYAVEVWRVPDLKGIRKLITRHKF